MYRVKVEPRSRLPIWSIALSAAISIALSLINIGSAVAFNAIVSFVVAAFFGSYFIPIAMVAHRRIKNIPLELGPWNLGRFGLIINLFALVWLFIIFVFSFFPIAVPVTLETMNWSCLLWGFMMISGALLYQFNGKTKFTGPSVPSEFNKS